mmetsp:Transcript_2216/g.4271  ORF Transcript_2216/g.4271 Transcript_2216/m.4271 type:complete len:220 (-) Transcript_2216:307-966(-)
MLRDLRYFKKQNVIEASLGAKGAYFLLFDDGTITWGNVSPSLNNLLENPRGDIKYLSLSLSNSNYYLEYQDGTRNFEASPPLHNHLTATCDMDPFVIGFSHDSIASHFSCGRSLEDTAEELACGEISAHSDIFAIRVVFVRNLKRWHTLDNRRLKAFQMAELECVPVVKLGDATAKLAMRICGYPDLGQDVYVRGWDDDDDDYDYDEYDWFDDYSDPFD